MFESDGKRHWGLRGASSVPEMLRGPPPANGASGLPPRLAAYPLHIPRSARPTPPASRANVVSAPPSLRCCLSQAPSGPRPTLSLSRPFPAPRLFPGPPYCTLHVLPDGFLKAAPSLSVSAGSLSRRDEARIWTRPATRPRAERRALSLRPAVRLGTS